MEMQQDRKSSEAYMRVAIELAKRGEGRVSPNPMVGCVVVKDGRVIAAGCHERYGGFHAERNALLNCREDTQGADLYVNLEPCCHYGKTPPCTDIIIEKKIRKVYIGCLDPNPKVAGKGAQILRDHGILTETGILEQECRRLNEVFFHYMEDGMPFVALKYAMTLDGKIACESGDSKWVTGEEARERVQQLRNRYRGIMVGIGTVLADDPMLNCRMPGGRDPVRIICDTRLRIPPDSRIVKTAGLIATVVAWNRQEAERLRSRGMAPDVAPLGRTLDTLRSRGVRLLEVPVKETAGRRLLDMRFLLRQLGEHQVDSILLEGGSALNASVLQERLAQRVYAFIAPKLVAGERARSPVGGFGIEKMRDAVRLRDVELSSYGEDWCVTGRIAR